MIRPGLNTTDNRPTARGSRAFTLVELIAVVAIIAILISAVLVASSTVINAGRTKNTTVILTIVRDAVDQFSAEQTRAPSLARATQGTNTARYKDRYGTFPPDEIEVFSPEGLPTAAGMPGSLGVGRSQIVPGPGTSVNIGPMRFYTVGLTPEDQALEFRDQTAMLAAIEMFSEAATSILDRIPQKNRAPGLTAANGSPVLFLDRPPTLNAMWNPDEDWPIRHIVDDWGSPIGYMSQRDWVPMGDAADSTNANTWNRTATQLIKLNTNQPIIFSYGPNGKDQLTEESMSAPRPESGNVNARSATLLEDWIADRRIDHPLNVDNLYAQPDLAEKLKKGAP
jgi:prepilin-type N-terminal cleavage/methylation domain-containing protein